MTSSSFPSHLPPPFVLCTCTAEFVSRLTTFNNMHRGDYRTEREKQREFVRTVRITKGGLLVGVFELLPRLSCYRGLLRADAARGFEWQTRPRIAWIAFNPSRSRQSAVIGIFQLAAACGHVSMKAH